MVNFIIGLIIGSNLAIFIMSLLVDGQDDDLD